MTTLQKNRKYPFSKKDAESNASTWTCKPHFLHSEKCGRLQGLFSGTRAVYASHSFPRGSHSERRVFPKKIWKIRLHQWTHRGKTNSPSDLAGTNRRPCITRVENKALGSISNFLRQPLGCVKPTKLRAARSVCSIARRRIVESVGKSCASARSVKIVSRADSKCPRDSGHPDWLIVTRFLSFPRVYAPYAYCLRETRCSRHLSGLYSFFTIYIYFWLSSFLSKFINFQRPV